jgi:hypothetical protein
MIVYLPSPLTIFSLQMPDASLCGWARNLDLDMMRQVIYHQLEVKVYPRRNRNNGAHAITVCIGM